MNYTKEQEDVINHISGNAVVIAGAGSGKTRCLVERTSNLCDTGYDPNRILVFTFTKKAAHEIKTRIAKRLETEVEDLSIQTSTIHSLALRIFRENKDDLDFEGNVTIWDPARRFRIISQMISELDKDAVRDHRGLPIQNTFRCADGDHILYPFNDAVEHVYTLEKINFFNDLKDQVKLFLKDHTPHPQKVDGKTPLAYYLDLQEKKVCPYVATLLAEYKKMKDLCSIIEFDDMLPAAVKILKQGKCKYVNYYQHIMVDEYQDVNQMNVDFVEALMGSNTVSLMAVGDDDQSIYGFRGGNVEHILKFNDNFGGKILYLTKNFRSSPEIVSLANQLISNNVNRYQKKMVATREGSFPDHWSIEPFDDIKMNRLNESQVEQYHEVFDYITGLLYFVEVDPKDIVVLARNNFNLRMAYHTFKKCNILRHKWNAEHASTPWKDIRFDISNIKSPFENKIMKDALLWANLLLNPKDCVAGREALLSTEKGFGGKTAIYLGKSATTMPDSNIVGWLRDLKQYPRHGEKTKKYKMIYALSVKIEEALNLLPQLTIESFWDLVLKYAHFEYRVAQLQKLHTNNGRPLNGLYAEEALTAKSECDLVVSSFSETLADDEKRNHQLMMDMIMTEIHVANEKPGVQMMTIHASKGMEWPYVFIIDLVQDVLPSVRCEDIEEERRLFYVGITRAEEQVIFSHFEVDNQYKRTEPSSFLSEIR